MSTQHAVQPRNPAGYGRGKGDRDTKNKADSESQLEKSVPNWSTVAGFTWTNCPINKIS